MTHVTTTFWNFVVPPTSPAGQEAAALNRIHGELPNFPEYVVYETEEYIESADLAPKLNIALEAQIGNLVRSDFNPDLHDEYKVSPFDAAAWGPGSGGLHTGAHEIVATRSGHPTKTWTFTVNGAVASPRIVVWIARVER